MDAYLKKMGLIKKNFQDEKVYVIGGLFLFIGGLIILLINYIVFIEYRDYISRILFLSSITTAAGLLDDISGNKEDQGFSGHISALLCGEITTGIFKASSISLAVFFVLQGNILTKILDFGILVFITNFMNLLDLRPGRSIKFFFLISWIWLVFLPEFIEYFIPVYFLLLLYLPREMNAIYMLGDSGSNLLGIILGFPVLFIPSLIFKVFIFITFLSLNLLAEKYSFTEMIAQNNVLNFIDSWGRD